MTKVAFDCSSFVWRGLLTGGDPEAMEVVHEDKKVKVNTAGWGYENVMNMMCRVFKETKLTPIDGILVFEGMSSKAMRLLISDDYKASRDSRPPQAYEQFQIVKELLEHAWRKVGCMIASQPYVEGDDTLAWLARETREDLIIASYDNDLAALNTEPKADHPRHTNAHGAKIQVWNDGELGINKFGVFDYHLITTYKAIVGDTSDNIKGCPGFGPAAFDKLIELIDYDGLQELQDRLEAGSLGADLHAMANEMKGSKPLYPLIRKICDNEQQVMKCYQLAKLHPEWVNTNKDPLALRAGIVLEPPPAPAYDERLKAWYGKKHLVTAENYDALLPFFARHLAVSPFVAFDIETSSADESDDWLAAQGDPDGVDQMGSTLTGFSFTFGNNLQHTIYVSVEHRDTANITMSQARKLIEMACDSGRPGGGMLTATVNSLDIVIHNTHFELPVLYEAQDEDGTYWRDHWADNGYHGFLPRALDNKLEASYVDENQKMGLKHRSAFHLGYQQVDYEKVTTLSGLPGTLPYGGRDKGMKTVVLKEAVQEMRPIPNDPEGGSEYVTISEAVTEEHEVRQYKMRELPATHVFDYGCDDTICTAAQHVYYKLIMEIEGTWDIYKRVEIDAAYQHAKNFVDGCAFSVEKSKELERADDAVYDRAWATIRTYLISKNWDGVVPPVYGTDIKLAEIKQAFNIVTGDELDTAVRTPSKIVKLLQAEGELVFSSMLAKCIESADGAEEFTHWVQLAFEGEPIFNLGSPLQMQNLMYDVMGLPIEVRGKPTDLMKKAGKPGSPKTNELAIKYAMRRDDVSDEVKAVLEALRLAKMVVTRRGLYYKPYPYFVHWKTGRIHPSHNQCATNTRRASVSKPNNQQQPKHQKIELALAMDEANMEAIIPRFRETIVPHKPGAVVVSMDFAGQELRVIADYSGDVNLTACFVGDNLKDVHSLTGTGIAIKRRPDEGWNYDKFSEVRAKMELDKEFAQTAVAKLVKEWRALGKKTNFVAEYGAFAEKVAETLMVTVEEAQEFLDAREAMFPEATAWKEDVKEEMKAKGYVTTMLGARRHLRDAMLSENYTEASKAERQAVNFKVQGSSGEMTKLAEGRMWKDDLFFDFDAVCYGPIHDECVASVMVDERFPEFIRRMHACMVAQYAEMKIPILSSISFGPSFGEQFEIGDVPTPEAVAAGLEAIKKSQQKELETV